MFVNSRYRSRTQIGHARLKRRRRYEEGNTHKYRGPFPETYQVRFDAQHNQVLLKIREIYAPYDELVLHAQKLSSVVTPLEFGGAAKERCSAAWRISASVYISNS